MKKKKIKFEEVSEKYFLESVSEYLESNSKGAVVSKILLATIALGGILCIGAVAPNVMGAMGKAGRFTGSMKRASVSATISRLKRNGLVYLESKKGVVRIRLTEKGRKQVFQFTDQMRIHKPLICDRKWRIVVFDIPVEKNREHTLFRRKIKKLGFQQIQKSVWAFPYKCEDEVLFFSKELRIEETIEIFTVQKMIHEKELRKRFDL